VISQCNPKEEDSGEQVDGNGGPPEGDDDTLEFVIQTLPFYLSRENYEPNLAIHAQSLLSQKIGEGKDKLHGKLRLLHEAIDLYLKVSFKHFISLFLPTFIGSTD
jgi:hypothetical protein